MAKKLYAVIVKGNEHRWSFPVLIDPRHVHLYRADGLTVEEIVNTVPVAVADMGMVKPWCVLQDIFNFKTPFKK